MNMYFDTSTSLFNFKVRCFCAFFVCMIPVGFTLVERGVYLFYLFLIGVYGVFYNCSKCNTCSFFCLRALSLFSAM